MVSVVVMMAAVVAVIRFLDPPESRRSGEFDGRTWLQPKDRGPLLLVNGITGIVEGQYGDSNVPPVEVLGSSTRASLIRWDGVIRLVSNSSLTAEDLPVDADDQVAVSDEGLWSASIISGRATLRSRDLVRGSAWQSVEVTGLPSGIESTSQPVVDGDGAHFLFRDDVFGYNLTVAPRSTVATVERVDETSRLVLVDGSARIITLDADGITPVAVVGDTGKVGSIESVGRQVAGDAFALWYGSVWTLDSGELSRIGDVQGFALGGRSRLYVDGGRLWGVGSNRAVSIGRRVDDIIIIELPDAVELCLGDCSRTSLQMEAANTTSSLPSSTSAPSTTPEQTTTVVSVPPPVSVSVAQSTTTTVAATGGSTTTTPPEDDSVPVQVSTTLFPPDFSVAPTSPISGPGDTEPPADGSGPVGPPEFGVAFDPGRGVIDYSYLPNGCADTSTLSWKVTTDGGEANYRLDSVATGPVEVREVDVLKVVVNASTLCGETAVGMESYVWEDPTRRLVLNPGGVSAEGLSATVSFDAEFFNGWGLAGALESAVSWRASCARDGTDVDSTVTTLAPDPVTGALTARIEASEDAVCTVSLVVSIARSGEDDRIEASIDVRLATTTTVPEVTIPDTTAPETTTGVEPVTTSTNTPTITPTTV